MPERVRRIFAPLWLGLAPLILAFSSSSSTAARGGDTWFKDVSLSRSKRIDTLNAVDKSLRTKDALTWVGGWHLIAEQEDTPWFGGLSSVAANASLSGTCNTTCEEPVRLLTITVRLLEVGFAIFADCRDHLSRLSVNVTG